MYEKFDERPSRPNRALQLWQILIAKASMRQVTTYGELETLLGYKGAGVFAQTLGHIMFYCEQNGLPPLTAVVVKKKTGIPGRGLTSTKDPSADREEVFRFHWYQVVPPSPEQFEASYRKGRRAP